MVNRMMLALLWACFLGSVWAQVPGAPNLTVVNGTISNYTSRDSDYTARIGQFIDCTTSMTLTLPPVGNTTGVIIVRKAFAGGSVTINGDGTDTINGSETATLTNQYDTFQLFDTGTEWVVF